MNVNTGPANGIRKKNSTTNSEKHISENKVREIKGNYDSYQGEKMKYNKICKFRKRRCILKDGISMKPRIPITKYEKLKVQQIQKAHILKRIRFNRATIPANGIWKHINSENFEEGR